MAQIAVCRRSGDSGRGALQGPEDGLDGPRAIRHTRYPAPATIPAARGSKVLARARVECGGRDRGRAGGQAHRRRDDPTSTGCAVEDRPGRARPGRRGGRSHPPADHAPHIHLATALTLGADLGADLRLRHTPRLSCGQQGNGGYRPILTRRPSPGDRGGRAPILASLARRRPPRRRRARARCPPHRGRPRTPR